MRDPYNLEKLQVDTIILTPSKMLWRSALGASQQQFYNLDFFKGKI